MFGVAIIVAVALVSSDLKKLFICFIYFAIANFLYHLNRSYKLLFIT